MTLCFVARISNPGERFGKPFYEVDVPSHLSVRALLVAGEVHGVLPMSQWCVQGVRLGHRRLSGIPSRL